MTCLSARRLLALFAGGDLKALKMSAVAGHVAACAACRGEVEAFTAARSLLPLCTLSFDESERALVRRRVLDEIASRRGSASPFGATLFRPRLALIAFAGALVLAASLVSPFFVRDAGERAMVVPHLDRPGHVATPIPAKAHAVAEEPLAPESMRRASRKFRPPAPPSKNLHPAMRFEILTGNANIRIIWFTGGDPESDVPSGSSLDTTGVS